MTDFKQVRDAIVDFINDNKGDNTAKFPDPYEVETGNVRTFFAFGREFNLAGAFPKIQVLFDESPHEYIGGQKQSTRRYKNAYSFIIIFYTREKHKWTFNSVDYVGDEMGPKYLEILRDTFEENFPINVGGVTFQMPVFGSISNAGYVKENAIFAHSIPMEVSVFKQNVTAP